MIQLQLRRELRAVVPLELPPRQKLLLRDGASAITQKSGAGVSTILSQRSESHKRWRRLAEALVAQEEFLTWGQFHWHYRALRLGLTLSDGN